MLRSTLKGLENVLESDIPQGSVVLVIGAEGALKSGFVFNIMSSYLKAHDGEHGLYVTLEQTSESHLRNMDSLGIKEVDTLHIFDSRDILREWKDREPNMNKITEEVIEFYKGKYNLTLFVLDSLNALSALSDGKLSRKDIYHLFSKLRENVLTSFVIMEIPHSNGNDLLYSRCQPERFLADGLIELGVIESAKGMKRYMQIWKMRATKHAMEKQQLLVGDEGIYVLGPIY